MIWPLISTVPSVMAKVDPVCATVEFVLSAHHGTVTVAAGRTVSASASRGVSLSCASSIRTVARFKCLDAGFECSLAGCMLCSLFC